jgi:phage tail-like protein
MTQTFEFQLHIKGPEKSWSFALPRGQTIIGRQIGSNLLLEHSQISRRHAQIVCTSTECQIVDFGSSNGTRLNNKKLIADVPMRVIAKDVIKIGPYEIEVDQMPVEIPIEDDQPPKVKRPEKPVPEEAISDDAHTPLQLAAAPPPPKMPPPPQFFAPQPDDDSLIPSGLTIRSTRLLDYLPDIYHTDFMSRFLAIFEAILTPIEWNINNFDLYLSPETAPTDFLSWLMNWFEITFDPTWREDQRRRFLKEAHQIYARRGTCWALSRVLEIYTGHAPEISDQDDNLAPFTFAVNIPLSRDNVDSELIEAIIDNHKPAYTNYELNFTSR